MSFEIVLKLQTAQKAHGACKMEKLIKKITEWILNYQEKYYAKKYKTALQNVQYSSKNSTTKTHAQAGIKLILNSKTEQNKKKLNEEVKEIVEENIKHPEKLLEYIEENGTKVYKIPYADKLLKFVGEEEGFITPVSGINALVLNIVLEHKFAFKTAPMFVLRDLPVNIYIMTHQFHKWYGYKMQLPGFDEVAQQKFKKIWEYEIDTNVQTLTYEEILSLKEAIARDIEAIAFVTKLAKEHDGAKKVFENIKNKGNETNI